MTPTPSTVRLLLVVAMMLVAASAPLAGSARQATPVPASPQPGAMPPTLNCPARPVTPAALVAILREPVPEDPAAADPRGDAVPPAERAAVGELVAAWAVCLASGDIPALLGVFTADGTRRLLGERSPILGGPAGLSLTIRSIADAVRLADGRIAVRVVVDASTAGSAPPETLIVIAERGDDDKWRIDHLRGAPAGAAGAAGPPLDTGARPLLRHPIAPGPGVPIRAPGPTVPMRGADAARTGLQFGPPPQASPTERWQAATGWSSDAQPIVARGMVYFGGFSLGERVPLLAAVDAASGGVRWQTTAPVAWATISDSPALGGDILFAPIEAPVAGIMAVAAATGEPLWFAPFGFTSVTAPAVDADAVYVAGWGIRTSRDPAQNVVSGTVFALDPRTGRERWRSLAPARFGPVSVGRDNVYVPSDRGLFAIERATGRKRWQARFSPGAGETASIAGATVVFAGVEITSGKFGVFALDAASGALRWRVDLPPTPGVRSGTAATGDRVFVTRWETALDAAAPGVPTLRAYDLASGEERWVFRADTSEAAGQTAATGSLTAPVVAGDMVLFGVAVRAAASGSGGDMDGLYAVDRASGALRWRAASSLPIRSASAVLDGTIYVMGGVRARGGATGGNLLAFGND